MRGLRPIRWVGQAASGGCVIASLAMIADMTYEAVNSEYPWVVGDRGCDMDTLANDFLYRHGFAQQPIWRHVPGPTVGVDEDVHAVYESRRRNPWPPTPWAKAHLCMVETGQYHAVVMLADGIVFDPLGPAPRRLDDYKSVTQVRGIFDVRGREMLSSQPDR